VRTLPARQLRLHAVDPDAGENGLCVEVDELDRVFSARRNPERIRRETSRVTQMWTFRGSLPGIYRP